MNRRRTLRFLGLLAVLFFGFIAAYLLVVRPTNVQTLNSSGTVMKFYQVQPRPLWGDYGTILINGMSGHLGRSDGRIQLERAGPFMPPATFPGLSDLVVTDEFRRKLEKSDLGHFTYRPVIKARIVDLQWQRWDLNAEDAPEVPETGEPEDYIFGRRHSPKLADEMGDVWEVVLNDGAVVDTEIARKPWDYDVRVHAGTWNGEHLYWGKMPEAMFGRWIIVTEHGKLWLEENAGEWVRFKPLPVKQ
jgi:hypothetical protein